MENTFTTIAGVTVRCRPVSETLVVKSLAKIEADYRARGEPLDPPTYTVQAVGGIETIPHDETTLEVAGDEAQTAANKAAWEKYTGARARLETEQKKRREWLWLLGGLDFEIPEDGWDKRQELLFGVTPPTDPVERSKHYIETELLPTVEDYLTALQTISLLSMSGAVDQEALKARMDTFRHRLQGSPAGAMSEAGQPVAAQPAAR